MISVIAKTIEIPCSDVGVAFAIDACAGINGYPLCFDEAPSAGALNLPDDGVHTGISVGSVRGRCKGP